MVTDAGLTVVELDDAIAVDRCRIAIGRIGYLAAMHEAHVVLASFCIDAVGAVLGLGVEPD